MTRAFFAEAKFGGGWRDWAGSTRGEHSRNAKLTEQGVREIRRTLNATPPHTKRGKEMVKRLATKHGISPNYVKQVWKRRTWSHVKDEVVVDAAEVARRQALSGEQDRQDDAAAHALP